jgi:hypothetical protein
MLRVQRPAAEKTQDLMCVRLGSEITRDDLLAALRSTRGAPCPVCPPLS